MSETKKFDRKELSKSDIDRIKQFSTRLINNGYIEYGREFNKQIEQC